MLVSKFYDIWPTLGHVGDMLTTFPTKLQLSKLAPQPNSICKDIFLKRRMMVVRGLGVSVRQC